jgi:TatD DNase family protein
VSAADGGAPHDQAFDPLFSDSKGRPVALPYLDGALVADTHAHLDMLDDPARALARATLAGVGFVATVADVTEDARRTYRELPEWIEHARALLVAAGHPELAPPRVRVILGAHPHNARLWDRHAEKEFLSLAADPLTCAVGEVGLDYHYDHSPREVQREVMRVHVELARSFGLPVVLHLREAHEDGLHILADTGVPAAGFILHCFNLGPEAMDPFLAMGCHVSFAGPVTFKKAEEVRRSARAVPRGRLLTETDCPFMAPEPFRGRACEPAFVAFTAARVRAERCSDEPGLAAEMYDSALALLDRGRA